MTIKVIGQEPRPGQARVSCPHCKKIMMADLTQYTIDMSKPLRSQCPYCMGEVFTALIVLSHKSLPQLGSTIAHVIQAVEEQVNPLRPDPSGTVLEGEGHKH